MPGLDVAVLHTCLYGAYPPVSVRSDNWQSYSRPVQYCPKAMMTSDSPRMPPLKLADLRGTLNIQMTEKGAGMMEKARE